jgi:hypothetical protein
MKDKELGERAGREVFEYNIIEGMGSLMEFLGHDVPRTKYFQTEIKSEGQ